MALRNGAAERAYSMTELVISIHRNTTDNHSCRNARAFFRLFTPSTDLTTGLRQPSAIIGSALFGPMLVAAERAIWSKRVLPTWHRMILPAAGSSAVRLLRLSTSEKPDRSGRQLQSCHRIPCRPGVRWQSSRGRCRRRDGSPHLVRSAHRQPFRQ